MNEYAVFIFGENYVLALENEPTQGYSFYVWRCVRASDEDEAKAIALQMVRDDEILNAALRNSPDSFPSLRVEEIRQRFGDLTPPGSGYIFYGSKDADAKPPRGFLAKVSSWFERK